LPTSSRGHTVTVEYFEAAGEAHLKVWFEKTIVSGDKWVGEYYNNPDFRDAPFLVREDDDLDFDWDDDEPVSGMNTQLSCALAKNGRLQADYDFSSAPKEIVKFIWIIGLS
jgi:hypothetical protein